MYTDYILESPGKGAACRDHTVFSNAVFPQVSTVVCVHTCQLHRFWKTGPATGPPEILSFLPDFSQPHRQECTKLIEQGKYQAILHMQISAPFCFDCGRHLERSFAAAKLLAGHSVCLRRYALSVCGGG